MVLRYCGQNMSEASIACRLLLHKTKLLAKLLAEDSNKISSRILVFARIADPANVSLIQQCRMLESIKHREVQMPRSTVHLLQLHLQYN